MSPLQEAKRLVDAGISVIPIRLDAAKRPAMVTWKVCEERLPTHSELDRLFADRQWKVGNVKTFSAPGLAAVCGVVSGGLEVLDFDEPGLVDEFLLEFGEWELPYTLVRVNTPSGGVHLWYRCSEIEGNKELAMRLPTPEELVERPKRTAVVMIETRGQGGYALLPGSPGECHGDGVYVYADSARTLTEVPTISPDDRRRLFEVARSFNRLTPRDLPKQHKAHAEPDGELPGDDFDRRGSWQEILEAAGATLAKGSWDYGRISRPGKQPSEGWSATIGYCRGTKGESLLHVFSSSWAELPTGTYGKFRAYACLFFRGDLGAAAKDLVAKGYGEKPKPKTPPAYKNGQAQAHGEAAEPPPWQSQQTSGGPRLWGAADLMSLELPPARFAVDGLMSEGLTILGGKPKAGKSWIALLMAWAVAAGQSLAGRKVVRGDVLYLALEDTPRRLQSRIRMLQPALGWSVPASLTIATDWPRADQGGIGMIAEWLMDRKGKSPMVIVDTLAKFRKPLKGNGNSYGDDYESLGELKKMLDYFGSSGLIVHHTRKLKSFDDPFDDLSGTLGLSGAADGIWILDRDRSERSGMLYVTGRDQGDATLEATLDPETCLWTLGTPVEGIEMRQHGLPKAGTKVAQAREFILDFLREYAHPSKELDQAARAAGYSGGSYTEAKSSLGSKGDGRVVFRKIDGVWWCGIGEPDTWKKRPAG